jgi:ribosomal protein S12 methylthiotransferase accessory factor
LHPNSTGLAAGSSRAHAIHGGMLEVIERDAAAIYWYNQLAVPTLDLNTLTPGPAKTILDRVRARGVALLAKDITTDLGVPSVMLLGRFSDGDQPVALCGFRADTDLTECLLGAAQELEHLLAMYHRSRANGRPAVPDPAAEPRDIWDFAMYYCHESRVGRLDFMADGPRQPAPAPPAQESTHAQAVDHVVHRLAGAGYEPIVVDITPVDVAECGVRVVRTVVPGLQPVSFHRTFRHLGGRRVFTAPVRMGLRDRERSEDELNPDPIPLG